MCRSWNILTILSKVNFSSFFLCNRSSLRCCDGRGFGLSPPRGFIPFPLGGSPPEPALNISHIIYSKKNITALYNYVISD